MRLAQLVIVVTLLIPATHSAQSKPPELPFFDWNACPVEGCVYRQWVARGPIAWYDTWKRTRQEIGQLVKDDKVVAITGVVITYKPGVIRLDRDYSVSEYADGGTRIDPNVPVQVLRRKREYIRFGFVYRYLLR